MNDIELRTQVIQWVTEHTAQVFKYIKELRVGAGINSINANDKDGFWIGNSSYASASFRVSKDGNTVYFGGGLKTAIVKTKKGYNALYCVESPNVWFTDFSLVKYAPWWRFWNTACTIYVDPMYDEVTEGEYFCLPTLDRHVVQIWRVRKGFLKTRFESKTKAQFDKNNKFWAH